MRAHTYRGHDFRSFSSKKADVGSTVRTIESLTLERRGDLITLRVSGDGFLYHMVRILAGTLLKVGRGQKNITDIRQALRNPRFQAAGPTAPARGLPLEKSNIWSKKFNSSRKSN